MKITNANQKECQLIWTVDNEYRIRIYGENHTFKDYDIRHCDLTVTICDEDAYLYEDGENMWLDHSPETLGVGETSNE